jgi:methyl-accepting chemotaxis protein
MLNRVSINILLKTVIVTLGAAVVIMLSLGAWDSWGRLNSARRAAAVTDSSAYLFTALHNLRVDRASTYRLLLGDKQLTTMDPLLREAREQETPALNSAVAALQGVTLPDKQAAIGELAEHIKRLKALQDESATALMQPKAARRAGLADEALSEMDGLVKFLDQLSTRLTTSIKLQDALVDQLMEIKQLAWIVRNAGGDASVVVSNTLGGRPLPSNAMDEYIANVSKMETAWSALKDMAAGMQLPPRFTQAIDKAEQDYFKSDYIQIRNNALKALIAGQPPGITVEQWSPMSVAKLSSLLGVANAALDVARDYTEGQRASALHDLIIQLVLMTTAVVVVCLMIWMVSSRVSRPLRALSEAMRTLADGDFTVTMPAVGRKDEIGMIAAAGEAVVERVGATIGNIKMAATEVTSASAEISTSTTDLSQRTEEQAASLEQTSASMEQISATVKKNAENAQQANAFAAETSAVAERGGSVVGNAVTAMARIEESSRKISDIITVIDEIARQTNLLALNAAVEAARAGEAGRGFAVVASEVRSLAQRSSQAAKDIKDLITNSNGQVKDGVDLVNKAGESLNEIVASIKKVATIVGDIANASIEQSTGLEQINKALSQMDEVTQQNSALVEENAATAKTLQQQAKSMDQRVASFRLRTDAAHDAAGDADTVHAMAHSAAAAPRPAPKVMPKATPKRQPAPAKRVALNGGGARHMQTALATAIDADADWKEF